MVSMLKSRHIFVPAIAFSINIGETAVGEKEREACADGTICMKNTVIHRMSLQASTDFFSSLCV